MNGKDYYAVLGVARDADQKELKKAYRKLARKYHPDVNPGDKTAENKFKELQEAYHILGNPEKRAQYDRFGQAGGYRQQAGGPRGGKSYTWTTGGGRGGFDFGDLGDIFSSFVGGAGPGGRRRTTTRPQATRRQDLSYPVELTFREAYAGATRVVNLNVEETCPTCRGRGAPPEGIQTCTACEGDGRSSGRSGFFDLSGVCEVCGGSGEVITKPCATCRGSGQVTKPRRLEVKIPAGVTEGQKIRMAGKGPGGGDIYLVAHIKPDPVFSRKGNDIWVEKPVNFGTAALGGEVEVPTMAGRATVKVPPETSSGQALRLQGKGFPDAKGGKPGDQYVRLKITVPKNLSDEEKELIRRLADMRKTRGAGREASKAK